MDFEDGSQSMNVGTITEGLNDLFPLTIAQLGRHSGADSKRFLPVLFLAE